MATLGSIAWYSVTGTIDRSDGRRRVIPVRVNHDQLEAWFREFGLETSYVPSTIQRIHAWRTATGDRVKWSYTVDGDPVTLTVDEVEVKDDFVTRHVMREVRGGERTHVATLRFIRGGRTSRGKRHSGDHWKSTIRSGVRDKHLEEVKAFIEHVDEEYKDLTANLHETKVRGILRDYLVKELNALPVRAGGGVYFVHNTHEKELRKLQQVVERMSAGCRLDQFPLLASNDAREMVNVALAAKIADAIRVLLEDVDEVVSLAESRRQRIAVQKFAEMRRRYLDVREFCEQYDDILGPRSNEVTEDLLIGKEAVDALKGHMDVGGGR